MASAACCSAAMQRWQVPYCYNCCWYCCGADVDAPEPQGGKTYDSALGVTCHWCRQKSRTAHVSGGLMIGAAVASAQCESVHRGGGVTQSSPDAPLHLLAHGVFAHRRAIATGLYLYMPAASVYPQPTSAVLPLLLPLRTVQVTCTRVDCGSGKRMPYSFWWVLQIISIIRGIASLGMLPHAL